nr:cation:dicarboxylase symporter family transporter [Geobacillus sp. DSP4a]
MLVITIIAGRESFLHDICFFYRASLGGPDERREQKFATLVGDHFGMSPTNILLTPYSTSSSETVLPKIMEKMERFGCPKAVTSFVVPTGYSFNLDGSTLYQALAAVFIAQLYGIDMPLSQQISLVLVLMVTSKGIAGVPGVSFVVLLATLGTVGIPVEGLAFIAGIDRILDMARTVVNVIGNSLAAVVMSKWEGQYNEEQGKQYIAELRQQSA